MKWLKWFKGMTFGVSLIDLIGRPSQDMQASVSPAIQEYHHAGGHEHTHEELVQAVLVTVPPPIDAAPTKADDPPRLSRVNQYIIVASWQQPPDQVPQRPVQIAPLVS
jgi:hypothetical protein